MAQLDSPTRISVLVADDSDIFLRAAGRIVQRIPQLNLLGTSDTSQSLFISAVQMHPQVILVDPGLEADSLPLLQQLRTLLPHTLIVVMTLLKNDIYRRAARESGADVFVTKDRLIDDLLVTIQQGLEEKRHGVL